MTKRFLLFSLGIMALGVTANAQVTTNAALLKEVSADIKIIEDANYEKAIILAKQKGWDLVL
ncbi:MAG: hypothetical protein H7068_01820, partial [Pedobacter sp.]|nr:hypothetical protein [Chitinophagaceae bacterium]